MIGIFLIQVITVLINTGIEVGPKAVSFLQLLFGDCFKYCCRKYIYLRFVVPIKFKLMQTNPCLF